MRVHDRGGRPDAGPIHRTEHEYTMWEKRIDAMARVLWSHGLMTVDEHRRAQESLEPGTYETLGYYERWLVAMEALLIEKGVLTRDEIDRRTTEHDTTNDERRTG